MQIIYAFYERPAGDLGLCHHIGFDNGYRNLGTGLSIILENGTIKADMANPYPGIFRYRLKEVR